MSRAFVSENNESWGDPSKRFSLPPRDDPAYDAAAAKALLEGARDCATGSAEAATGYYWGEAKLRPYIEALRDRARKDGDDRLEQLAERFLR